MSSFLRGDTGSNLYDWEIGALYLRLVEQTGSEEVALQGVHDKFMNTLCSDDRDTCFFVGNLAKHPKSWMVLGVFWPPKSSQGELPLGREKN